MNRFQPLRDADLTVRMMSADDAANVQRTRNLPEVARYQGWRPPTVEEVVALAHEQRGRAPGMQTEPCQLVPVTSQFATVPAATA